MKTAPLQCVIFDLDGTLIDSENIYHHSWVNALESEGLNIPTDLESIFRGQSAQEKLELIQKNHSHKINLNRLMDSVIYHTELIIEKNNWPLKSGTLELLQWLNSKNIPMGVATNSLSKTAKDKLEKSGIKSFFLEVVGVDCVLKGKPSPEIFNHTINLMSSIVGNNLRSAGTFIVEDSKIGIQAAKQVSGIQTILIPDDPDLKVEVEPDYQFADLTELLHFFSNLANPRNDSYSSLKAI